MTYRSILFVAAGDSGDTTALDASAVLAARFGAQLRVVPAFADAAANYLAYGAALKRGSSEAAADAVRRGEREAQTRLEEIARVASENADVRIDVEERGLEPGVTIAKASVLADLVVFGGQSVRGSGACAGVFAETLLENRTPVLLARRGAAVTSAAIAWDGSIEAGRAVRAAMPLLQHADRVLIFSNGDDIGTEAAGAEQAGLHAHLGLHGVANVDFETVCGSNVATSLLDAAKRNHCDVLVSGAYGRPRLYEWILGGTTRALVGADDGPSLLLAH